MRGMRLSGCGGRVVLRPTAFAEERGAASGSIADCVGKRQRLL